MRDSLPNPVSIKREYLSKRAQIHKILHAIGRVQKNPRRELILTGIYANNSKLKYGGCSFASTMLIFQTGNKQARNAISL